MEKALSGTSYENASFKYAFASGTSMKGTKTTKSSPSIRSAGGDVLFTWSATPGGEIMIKLEGGTTETWQYDSTAKSIAKDGVTLAKSGATGGSLFADAPVGTKFKGTIPIKNDKYEGSITVQAKKLAKGTKIYESDTSGVDKDGVYLSDFDIKPVSSVQNQLAWAFHLGEPKSGESMIIAYVFENRQYVQGPSLKGWREIDDQIYTFEVSYYDNSTNPPHQAATYFTFKLNDESLWEIVE